MSAAYRGATETDLAAKSETSSKVCWPHSSELAKEQLQLLQLFLWKNGWMCDEIIFCSKSIIQSVTDVSEGKMIIFYAVLWYPAWKASHGLFLKAP